MLRMILLSCDWDDGLQIFWRLNQRVSAGDGLALNRLAMARNSGGLQV